MVQFLLVGVMIAAVGAQAQVIVGPEPGQGESSSYYIWMEGVGRVPRSLFVKSAPAVSAAAPQAVSQEAAREVKLEDGAVVKQFASVLLQTLDVAYLEGEWVGVMSSDLQGKASYWPAGLPGGKMRFVDPGEAEAGRTPFGPVAGPKLRPKVSLAAGLALVEGEYDSAIERGGLALSWSVVTERVVVVVDGIRIDKPKKCSLIECRRVDQRHMICHEMLRDDEKWQAGIRYFGLRREEKAK